MSEVLRQPPCGNIASVKMPFSNQFALSVEVTRLVPLALAAAYKSSEAVMSLARDLRKSGSDIVIEEDLAYMFGRCRIAQQLESSFRTITNTRISTPLAEGLTLEGGPGPTVLRALKHSSYFATVVQLSLLCWVHEKVSLSEGLLHALERRVEEAPADASERSLPSQAGLLGVIRACEEQTAAFDWTGLLFAIGQLLRVDRLEALSSIAWPVLTGLLDMFPLVQSLPEDRMILVESDEGTCALCVWAFHVLGLTVLVKSKDAGEVRLGTGTEQMIIECRAGACSVSLLDSRPGDVLLSVTEGLDDYKIDAAVRIPANGYGRLFLSELSPDPVIGDEMMLVTTALAITVAGWLAKTDGTDREPIGYEIDVRRIYKAAQFLFKEPSINKEKLDPYIGAYKIYKTLKADRLPTPASFASIKSKGDGYCMDIWKNLLWHVMSLILLILAFSHVQNIDHCDALPLGTISLLMEHMFHEQLQLWNADAPALAVSDDTWFTAIGLLIMGRRLEPHLDTACLLSDRGWSIFMSTFGTADPAHAEPGQITIIHGVPSRQGVRKQGILDGPRSGLDSNEWQRHETASDVVKLSCINKILQGPTQCGERGEYFVFSLRLTFQIPSEWPSIKMGPSRSRRSGYRELHRALWTTQTSARCEHGMTGSLEARLPPGSTVIEGFVDTEMKPVGGKIAVLLTAHNRIARWRALIGVTHHKRRVLLRQSDCCCACVLSQAASKSGDWYVIL